MTLKERGLTVKEVATELNISRHTAAHVVSHVLAKAGAHSTLEFLHHQRQANTLPRPACLVKPGQSRS